MALTITSLRCDYRVTPAGNLFDQDVPYLIVNCTFRITDDEHLEQRTKAECEEYRQVLTIKSPEHYEEALKNWDLTFENGYKYGRAWIHNECPYVYLKKFDTFWFREWIADSPVTRTIIAELEHFKEHGRFGSVYRHVEDYIVISHLHALDRYWD